MQTPKLIRQMMLTSSFFCDFLFIRRKTIQKSCNMMWKCEKIISLKKQKLFYGRHI